MKDWVRLRAAGKEVERLFDEGKAYTDLIYVGKWIDPKPNLKSPHAKQYKCSVCGDSNYKSNFCPNCGADMREGDVE